MYVGEVRSGVNYLDIVNVLAKGAFYYSVYGCSDPSRCPYGEDEQGKPISACKRYFGKEQCLSENHDSSCLANIK